MLDGIHGSKRKAQRAAAEMESGPGRHQRAGQRDLRDINREFYGSPDVD